MTKVKGSLIAASLLVGVAGFTTVANAQLAACSDDQNACLTGTNIGKPVPEWMCRTMYRVCMKRGHWIGYVSKKDMGPRERR